jgi:hypothetical protein
VGVSAAIAIPSGSGLLDIESEIPLRVLLGLVQYE